MWKKVGYPAGRGLGGICVHTLLPIMCENVRDEVRYFQPADDPEPTVRGQGEEARTLLAAPIVGAGEADLMKERVARGVIIAINKEKGERFTAEDADNLALYNSLVTKIFDVVT